MRLIIVHQILIGSAIGLAVLFGLRSAVLFARHGGREDLALAVASVAVAGLLAIYLRKVRARCRSADPQGGNRPG
jgi:hypothetical protein